MKRLPVAIPILASLASFILVLLACFAGYKPGHMEDYDILTFNTSALGKNLLSNLLDDYGPTPTQPADGDTVCDGLPSFLGKPCGSVTSAAASLQSEIIDKIDDINNEIADKLADRLGIHEFYSLHILTICDGEFEPNATAPDAGKNVTSCKHGLDGGYNISAALDKELTVGPLHITLRDLGLTSKLQGALDDLYTATKALAILFIITTALVGLAFITSLQSIFLIPGPRENTARITNLVISALAALLLLITSALVTLATSKAVEKVNDLGADIGLSARRGTKYLAVAWAATGVFLLGGFGFWLVQTWRWRRRGGGAKSGFPPSGGGDKSHRHDGQGPEPGSGVNLKDQDRSDNIVSGILNMCKIGNPFN